MLIRVTLTGLQITLIRERAAGAKMGAVAVAEAEAEAEAVAVAVTVAYSNEYVCS